MSKAAEGALSGPQGFQSAILARWDKALTRATNTAVDAEQARLAVEVVMPTIESLRAALQRIEDLSPVDNHADAARNFYKASDIASEALRHG